MKIQTNIKKELSILNVKISIPHFLNINFRKEQEAQNRAPFLKGDSWLLIKKLYSFFKIAMLIKTIIGILYKL